MGIRMQLEIGATKRGAEMQFTYVDSEAVDQIGYDEDSQELHVIFKRGKHCIYSGIPKDVFDDFLNAPSKGIFLNEVIKARGYSFRYN